MFSNNFWPSAYFSDDYWGIFSGFIPPVIAAFWCAWTGNSSITGGGNLPGEVG